MRQKTVLEKTVLERLGNVSNIPTFMGNFESLLYSQLRIPKTGAAYDYTKGALDGYREGK